MGWTDFYSSFDDPLIDCEAFISQCAHAKWADNGDDAELLRALTVGRMREDVEKAIQDNKLTARSKDGLRSSLPPRGDCEPFEQVFFEREEFIAFAREHWLVRPAEPQSAADAERDRTQANASEQTIEVSQPGGKTTHRVRTRVDVLSAVIRTAKSNAENPSDYLSVWAALVRLAEADSRPAPLCGYVECEGVKYQTDKSIKFFTKDALRKRMNPNAR